MMRARAKNFGSDENINDFDLMDTENGLAENGRNDSNQANGNNTTRKKLNNSNVSVSADSLPETSEESITIQSVLPLEKQNNFEQMTLSTNPTNEPVAPTTTASQLAIIEFQTNEIMWAKIKGFPAWPAKIISFPSNKMVLVLWFNDY